MRRYIIECSNPECPKKGDGPNGRLILGKAQCDYGKFEVRCRTGCKKITRLFVCKDCGKTCDDNYCVHCEETKKQAQLRKIDNARLRAILEE